MDKRKMTDFTGNGIANDNSSLTLDNLTTYTAIQDVQLFDKLAHFNRERIPERVVHAKGGGAYGYFVTTNDLSQYTMANLFDGVGKTTEVFARFSTVGGSRGSADSVRDPRGFALKFYTSEGNYDLVGNNTPTFFIRDAMKFPDLIHSVKNNPSTNASDPNMMWDFFSLTPESIHQVTILMSDRGIPLDFRHMDGFSSHTFMWYNKRGEHTWVKYHFKSEQGIANLTQEEADILAGKEPNYSILDLYNAIAKGDFPSWKVFVQLMTEEDSKKYKFNPFDITKVWYHADYPLIPLGRLVLNRNPVNAFVEVEQTAFCPSNVVPGISFSPDKLLQGRLFSYKDAHHHRLGSNVQNLANNRPKLSSVNNYARDGIFSETDLPLPNYYPNSYENSVAPLSPPVPKVHTDGNIFDRYDKLGEPIDFVQADALYSRVMTEEKRELLIHNIRLSLSKANINVQYRQCALFYLVNPDYGKRVALALKLDLPAVISLSQMSQEERLRNTLQK